MVIYKKEAFEKFQTLLWRLKADVTTYLVGVNLDFNTPAVQQSTTESDYVHILEAASKQAPNLVKQTKTNKSADDVEVFEV